MSDQAGTELADLNSFIRDTVSRHWVANSSPLLLTALGQLLRSARPQFVHFVRDGLKNYLTQSNIVTVVTDSTNPGKVGAIPIEVKKEGDDAFRQAPKGSNPRLDRTFWAAFTTPILGKRFVVLTSDDPPSFQIQDRSDGTDREGYEISPQDIARSGSEPVVASEVWSKILAWLTRNRLPLATFKPLPKLDSRVEDRRDSVEEVARALARLSPQEQSRITIPLDLVAKMLAKP